MLLFVLQSSLLGFSLDGVLAWRTGEGLHASGATEGYHAIVCFDSVDGSGGFVVDGADVIDRPSGYGSRDKGGAEQECSKKWLHWVAWAGLQCASKPETR